ncbi:hypothetical protein Tco_0038121 [Tanacetum coccineum]
MADIKTKTTMEEFATKDRANHYSGITSITVNGKNAYELKGKFLYDLRNNAFSGTNGEDAVEHIEYFLKIVDPINLSNVNYERPRLAVFLILLVENASKWFDEFKSKKDPTSTMFAEWLDSKFTNHNMMDPFTKKVLWDFWKKDYENELNDEFDEQWSENGVPYEICDHRDHIRGPYVNFYATRDPYLDDRNGNTSYKYDSREKEEHEDEERCELFDDSAQE